MVSVLRISALFIYLCRRQAQVDSQVLKHFGISQDETLHHLMSPSSQQRKKDITPCFASALCSFCSMLQDSGRAGLWRREERRTEGVHWKAQTVRVLQLKPSCPISGPVSAGNPCFYTAIWRATVIATHTRTWDFEELITLVLAWMKCWGFNWLQYVHGS